MKLLLLLFLTSCALSYSSRVDVIRQKAQILCKRSDGVKSIDIFNNGYAFQVICNDKSMYAEETLNVYDMRDRGYRSEK